MPCGEVTVHQETGFGDRDGDGDTDATDYGAIAGACTGSSSGACRVLDVNNSGTVNSSDQTPHAALPQGLLRKPGLSTTGLGQVFAHQGLPLDAEVGSYQNRARVYNAALRRFAQYDGLTEANSARLAYSDGMSLSGYLRSNPLRWVDPVGFGCCPPTCTEISYEKCPNPVPDTHPYHVCDPPVWDCPGCGTHSCVGACGETQVFPCDLGTQHCINLTISGTTCTPVSQCQCTLAVSGETIIHDFPCTSESYFVPDPNGTITVEEEDNLVARCPDCPVSS